MARRIQTDTPYKLIANGLGNVAVISSGRPVAPAYSFLHTRETRSHESRILYHILPPHGPANEMKQNSRPRGGLRPLRGVAARAITVDDEGFKSMDRLEGYPRLYRREEIDVFTSQGRARAWVYIMNRLPEGAKVIAGGDWREYRRKGGNR